MVAMPKDEIEIELRTARGSLANNPNEPVMVQVLARAVAAAYASGKVARNEVDGPSLMQETLAALDRIESLPGQRERVQVWRGFLSFSTGDYARAKELLSGTTWDADLYTQYVKLGHLRGLSDEVLSACKRGYHSLTERSDQHKLFKACAEASPNVEPTEVLLKFATQRDVDAYLAESQRGEQRSRERFKQIAAKSGRHWDCLNICRRYYEGCGHSPQVCREQRINCEQTCEGQRKE